MKKLISIELFLHLELNAILIVATNSIGSAFETSRGWIVKLTPVFEATISLSVTCVNVPVAGPVKLVTQMVLEWVSSLV